MNLTLEKLLSLLAEISDNTGRIADALEAQRPRAHLQCGSRLSSSRCSLAAGHGGKLHINLEDEQPMWWPVEAEAWTAVERLSDCGEIGIDDDLKVTG